MGASWVSQARDQVPAPGPEEEPQEEPEVLLDLSQLPPELLLQVLSHVPPRTLLGRCRPVCQRWRALVDSQALWLLVLARDRSAAGRAVLQLVRSYPPLASCRLGCFCELRPLGRNLIRNPCGQEGLRQWKVQHGGSGWAVEENIHAVPGAPAQTCFVTSFRWCSKKQILNLEEEGLWPELLDSGELEICVSDWWGARHDSGCRYRLHVQLLDANHVTLDKFSVAPDPVQQWNNSVCFRVSHVFSTLPTGVRFVSFEHWGQDTQFWAGHYGARVTNSNVTVRVRQSSCDSPTVPSRSGQCQPTCRPPQNPTSA